MTGNVERFISKLNMNAMKITDETIAKEEFICVTYTTGFGCVPEITKKFLNKNYPFLKGVSSSGNKNWGKNYAKSADVISLNYNVPIISKFELSGTKQDVEYFKRRVKEFEIF